MYTQCKPRILVVMTSLILVGDVSLAQMPDHPIITEVYTDPDPSGSAGDGPVGRDPTNRHQEFIEIYLPTASDLNPALNKNALNLTLYEVEGDRGSSGYTLINYRIDLPTFDLEPPISVGAVGRPPSGIVVLAWVDYADDPPTEPLGAPNACVALIGGGITSATDFVVVAINGRQGTGCSNFEVPDPSNPDPDDALSLINMPGEATSGIIQNGSSAYLLVNRDVVGGYVKLYDDKDTGHVPGTCSCFPCDPSCTNADPSLATGSVLGTSSFLDGLAGNDDGSFEIDQQPYPINDKDDIDLVAVLPRNGAYSLLIPQIPENGGNGYLRLFTDIAKTTEDAIPGNEDPVIDAMEAYRTISNLGPWVPTPGRATSTTSPPELRVADGSLQIFQVLAETTGRPGLLAANIGGGFAIEVTATPGPSSNPGVATFGPGDTATVTTGQTPVFPSIAVTVGPGAVHGETATSDPVNVAAVKVNAGDPDLLNSSGVTTATIQVLKPTTGLDAAGLPFQKTVFIAVQAVPAQVGVTNEFAGTDLGIFIANNLGGVALDTFGNGATLVNPATDISNPLVVGPMIKELPGEGDLEVCITWKNPAGPPGKLDLAQTVVNSAEVLSGATSYEASIATCVSTGQTVIKAIRVNVPDTLTFGGTFSPTDRIHFVDPRGNVGDPQSGLSNATTSRGFEIALIDTAVRTGGLETGRTDDFGIIVEVEETEPGASVVDGEFVFLSFTGGLQGADIDTLDVPPGNNVATIILLDLDNLHDDLGIRSIEALYIIDAGDGGEVDIIEGFSLNPSAVFFASALPASGESLWRSHNNTMRLTFATNITAPNPGEILIQQMLDNGDYGTDLSGGFEFTVENNAQGFPRILKIVDVDPPDLVHRQWYAVRSLGGVWSGDFTVQYVVQIGDATNLGVVANLDVGLINDAIPVLSGAGDQDRRDINGDGGILNDDASTANERIPSFRVPKPSGH